jgi:Tn3 transposase DDE domain
MHDIEERKLYLLSDQTAPTSLKPLVGGVIDPDRHDHVLGRAQEAVGLPTPERSRQGATRGRRIERTLFTLDWIKNPALRRRAQLGLNKGEARDALARAIYFCRLG